MKAITAFVLLIMTASSLSAQSANPPAPEMSQVMRVATEGLSTLRALAEKVPTATGLTPKDAADARLAAPLRIFFVPLDRLRTYRSDADPRALLQDVRAFFFPVSVGAEIRSSLTVKELRGQLVASDFGQAELAKLIASARGESAGSAAILVRIPALNLYFIGRTDGTLTLTPIAEVPGLDLQVGKPANAADVFPALSAMAQKLNGDPT
jgi:hypothetical protein